MKGIKQKDAVYWTHNKSVACLKENWKCIIDASGEFLLYDIEKDPSELHNVKADFPQVAKQLENQLRTWQKEIQEI